MTFIQRRYEKDPLSAENDTWLRSLSGKSNDKESSWLEWLLRVTIEACGQYWWRRGCVKQYVSSSQLKSKLSWMHQLFLNMCPRKPSPQRDTYPALFTIKKVESPEASMYRRKDKYGDCIRGRLCSSIEENNSDTYCHLNECRGHCAKLNKADVQQRKYLIISLSWGT